jgi:holo-[acyl-carrier protein] synthase
MLLGIGTDIIEVQRVETKINKEIGFRELVFSENEIAYCEAKTHKFEHYAARFAAKEALMKALGTGWAQGLTWNEIEILNEENGKPVVSLLGETAKTIQKTGFSSIHVSLSHLKNMAPATVIIEK